MDISSITKTITRFGKVAGLKISKHSPTILTVVGTGSIVGAGVMACKATLKLNDTMVEAHEDIEQVKTNYTIAAKEPDVDGAEEYLDKTYRKELTMAYFKAVKNLIFLYGPSVLMTAAGIGCIFSAKKIMDNRYSSCLAACSVTERMFADYRQRVKDDLGEDADRKYRLGLQNETIEVPELDKRGNPKMNKDGSPKTKKETTTKLLRDMPDSDFARIFEEGTSREWDNNVDVNVVSLLQRQNMANQMLKSRGYLFLNEVYSMLGFPITDYGQDVGWIARKDVSEDGDGYVDFGLYKAYKPGDKETRLEHMSRDCNAIVLDFNVDGYIKDKVWNAQFIWD